jgi:hypothetical protein
LFSEVDPDWIKWLEFRKHCIFQNKYNEEYVTIDKMDFFNKFYILNHSDQYYKVMENQNKTIKIIGLNRNHVSIYENFDYFYNSNSNHIYEFNSFDDFVSWYMENKKCIQK